VKTIKTEAANSSAQAATGQTGPKAMPRLTLRIDFDAERAIGPGKVRLLELIDKHGSISAAGRQMEMSRGRAQQAVSRACQPRMATAANLANGECRRITVARRVPRRDRYRGGRAVR
jgi:hypothetical protein